MLSLTLALLPFAKATAQETIDVHFARGASSATLTGHLQGRDFRDYRVSAAAGQVMTVEMRTKSTAAYFNVLPPGSNDVADFIGSTLGQRYQATLAKSGAYTVRVYQMRSAGRRNEGFDYSLTIAVTGKPRAALGPARAGDAKVAGTRYHATGTLPCSMGDAAPRSAQCAFGVIRGEPGNAEVHLTPPGGLERVLQFRGKDVSAGDARVSATRQSDEWVIIVNDYEHFVVPDAVVVGG